MTQPIKALVAKPVDLSSVPKTHMVEEKGQLRKVVFWPPCVAPPTHTE